MIMKYLYIYYLRKLCWHIIYVMIHMPKQSNKLTLKWRLYHTLSALHRKEFKEFTQQHAQTTARFSTASAHHWCKEVGVVGQEMAYMEKEKQESRGSVVLEHGILIGRHEELRERIRSSGT